MFQETFRSLRHKNYRLFFIGQFFSLIGLWMHNVGQSWLVWELTRSSFWLGVMGFISTIPILFISLFAGVLADRFSKLKLNFIIQFVALVQAFALGYLVFTGLANFNNVAILVFSLGVINAFEIPIRQSFTVELVGKDDLQNAIGLNSAIFNTARIVGPIIAGVVILNFGVAWCFFFNSISYLAILVTMLLIKKNKLHRTEKEKENVFDSIKKGFDYIKSNREVLQTLLLVGVMTLFGWQYTVLLPVFADDIFNLGAKGLSSLYTANGFGALFSALFIATTSKKVSAKIVMQSSIVIFILSAFAFALTNIFFVAMILMVGCGVGLVGFFVSANSHFQNNIPHNLRGRLLGFYVIIFQGLHPFGSLFIGSLGKSFGVQMALIINVFICGIISILILKNYKTSLQANQ